MKRAEVLHFTPSDYLAEYKTRRLDLEEHGAYHLLLWHMWEATDEQCIFPLDYRALSGIWGVSAERAEQILDSLLSPGMCLFQIVNRCKVPHLLSKRLREQAEAARTFAAAQSAKGKRSGAVRRANSTNPGSTPVRTGSEPSVNPNEPSCPRSPVARKHVDPIDTKPVSGLTDQKRSGRGSYQQPLEAWVKERIESKFGVTLNADARSSIARWLKTDELATVETAIEVTIEKKGGLDLKYANGCLSKWRGAAS